MIEAGVVIDKKCEPLFWHLPPGRTAGSIPDTRQLWDVIWGNRDIVKGFAHSHPGSGPPAPSETDLGTFVAIEAALGRSLTWWITSSDRFLELQRIEKPYPPWGVHSYTTRSGVQHHYLGVVVMPEMHWAQELRTHSEAQTLTIDS